MIIFAFDGLEYNYVKEFNCKNLMQKFFGKTDISEFTEPRTVVIWSSFLTGRNAEKEVLKFKNLWEFKVKPNETFFNKFKKWKAIDVPGFNYNIDKHRKERELLKGYFEKKNTIEEYDKIFFKHHQENKKEFLKSLKENYEIIMAYFPLADGIGHLSFGIKTKMKLIYMELENFVKEVWKLRWDKILIISDHGMKSVGRFGDHNNYGFWSSNFKINFKKPKITEFRTIIENQI
jgi:hypothetical protein